MQFPIPVIKKKITNEVIKKYNLRHIRLNENIEGYIFINKPNGLVGFVSVENKDNNTKWIQALEVSKSFRGMGLGYAILDFAVTKLGGRYLSVRKTNKIAYRMFIKYGFKSYMMDDYMYFMKLKE